MTSKRLVLFVALVGLLFVMAGVGTVAAQSAPDCSAVSYNGAGTEANPYEVGNVDQLQCIEEQGLDANYEVVSDIDASETAAWNSGKGFDPLGDDEDDSVIFFTGTFDGGSHTITDLTINRPSEDTVALFEAVGDGTDNGKVKDIRFEWVDVTGSATVAPLAGSNLGTIIRSSASGNADGDDNVGGLVGRNQNGEVSDSYATTEVEGSGSFGQSGGLVGFNSGTIERSHATGDVVGTSRAGGIVGRNTGTISKSYASGDVDGNNRVGGLVGLNSAQITESYATGEVDGDDVVGGLAGQSDDTVTNSYARGDVEATSGSTGGFIGFNTGNIENSYSIGDVTGGSSVGGFIAVRDATIPIQGGYWDKESSGIGFSTGGEGLTTSQMTGSAAPNNMQGFDFTNTWETITNPDDYPILAWQQPTASFTPSTNSPNVDEAITFDASASSDSDGSVVSYAWDFDGDGTTDIMRTAPLVTHTYDATGTYAVTLTVIDDDGATDSTVTTVEVRDPSTSPVEGVSDALWTAVTQNDGNDGLSLADLGNAIQEYQDNPGDADVAGVSITLSDLGSLIQYYRNEVV